MVEVSDLEHLCARGDLELADRLCDAEINRLLSVKKHISQRMLAPTASGNICMGPDNCLYASVFPFDIVRRCPHLGCRHRLARRKGRFVDHKSAVGADISRTAIDDTDPPLYPCNLIGNVFKKLYKAIPSETMPPVDWTRR